MNKILLLLLIINTLTFGVQAQERYSKVKIYCTNEQLLELSNAGIEADHGERKSNTFLITDISESELALISSMGFNYEIVALDVKQYYADRSKSGGAKNVTCSSAATDDLPEVPDNFYQNSAYAGFYNYQDMLDALDEMAAQYPNLITVKAPISSFLTHENRPIYHVKISDNPSVDESTETKVLYTAIHHAREPLSMSQLIFYMWYILENYDSSEEIQYLVNNTEMYFVPCMNPDGYLHNEANDPAGFGMHRKNKRNVGSTNPGVDNNRNYSYGWNTTGVSADPNNDTYPGTSAFSEPENQAIKWLVENVNFTSAFNAHTYGNTLLYPIGTTSAEFADHHDYFVDISAHMCMHNGYFPQKSSGLYPASGDADDYMYKVDIGVGEKDTIYAWTPEIGTDFWPAENEIVPTCQGMVFPNLVLSHMTHQYVYVKDEDPQLLASSTGDFNHNVFRYGLVDGPVDVSITPLLNIQSVGSPIQYDLALRESVDGAISYVLNPAIQPGDEVRYILNTIYPDWTYRDTITKIFGALTVQYSENGNSNSNWTGPWSTTTDEFYSPSSSFTDSDGGDYLDDVNETYTFVPTIDLTNAVEARVSFYAKWEIEADYDYCQFQVSTDNGSSWEGQCGLYTVEGSSTFWNGSVQPNGEPVWEGTSDWVYEEINLSDYLGQEIKVRFQLESDGGVRRDGFYFDDFQVSFNEESSAGIGKQELIGLKVFPNPASESATVYSDGYLEQGTRILIYDNSGKIAMESVNDHKTNQIILELTGIAKGFYTVELRNEQGSIGQTKLVIR
jgi:hypothetical protein